MRQSHTQLTVATNGKGLTPITSDVDEFLATTGIETGVLTLFCRHTSASLLIQENADRDVQADLARFFEEMVPESATYAHRSEGRDDMPAHIRAALTQTSLSIPVLSGSMALGTWQGLYVFEHRRAPHRRSIILHIAGD